MPVERYLVLDSLITVLVRVSVQVSLEVFLLRTHWLDKVLTIVEGNC